MRADKRGRRRQRLTFQRLAAFEGDVRTRLRQRDRRPDLAFARGADPRRLANGGQGGEKAGMRDMALFDLDDFARPASVKADDRGFLGAAGCEGRAAPGMGRRSCGIAQFSRFDAARGEGGGDLVAFPSGDECVRSVLQGAAAARAEMRARGTGALRCWLSDLRRRHPAFRDGALRGFARQGERREDAGLRDAVALRAEAVDADNFHGAELCERRACVEALWVEAGADVGVLWPDLRQPLTRNLDF